MIARIWRGFTSEADGNQYFDYLTRTGLKDYRSTDGNRGVVVLRRVSEGRAEFLLVSFWESFDSIQKFAGPDVEKAVYYPEDERFLLELEPNVAHYELLFEAFGSLGLSAVPSAAFMKHNVYFDGKVQSLGLKMEQGPATVGVITPGHYTFSTEFEEYVVITTGTLRVRLPHQEWKTFTAGEKYIVPPKSSFEVEADGDVSYVCHYK